MAIVFEVEDNITLPEISVRNIKTWIKTIIKSQDKKCGDIGYQFCSDNKILEVNKEYLDHDYYTDIITFDYCEGNIVSGDMYISVDTVLSNAMQYNTSPKEELLRVIIHGILHLCGFGDKTDEEVEEMRKQESIALSLYKEMYSK